MKNFNKNKIGLALSSGSAHGLAHIGVLKVLERENIKIDFIAGTSIGAYLGAIWASGISASSIEKFVLEFRKKSKILSIMDFSISRSGLLSGKRVISYLESIMGDRDFSELKIPLAVVAMDLSSGCPVIITKGSVSEAVRASISLPGIFEPVRYSKQILIDGGFVEPVPVNVLKEMGANKIIASNVITCFNKNNSAKIFTYKRMPSAISVIVKAMEIVEREMALVSCKGADIVIQPDVMSYRILDFTKVKKLIRIGELEAEKYIHSIKQLVKNQI